MNSRLLFVCSAFFSVQVLAVGESFAQGLLPPNTDATSTRSDAITVSGASGGLLIPDGRVLNDGVVSLGFNNFVETRFANAARGENYVFAIGLFPLLEASARLANYPIAGAKGYGAFYASDLSANMKLQMPRLFQMQPDIAFGINDMGGGAPMFQSKYLVASQSFGELRVRLGKAKGDAHVNGWLGGAELALGESGLSVLTEYSNHFSSGGVRYRSPAIALLGDARVNLTLQRRFGDAAIDGVKVERTSFGVSLAIPLGDKSRAVIVPKVISDAVWTMPSGVKDSPSVNVNKVSAAPAGKVPSQAAMVSAAEMSIEDLRPLQVALEKAGLERVRVGLAGQRLVLEYENHRYNQNEVDAIGVVFGLAVRLAPSSVAQLAAVTKKAGLALYETRADRSRFQRFIDDGDVYDARVGFDVVYRPAEDVSVQWLDVQEGKRGYSRVVLQPKLASFVGTEVGVFDYSLAAKVDAIVPAWKGAEVMMSYVSHLADSENVRPGQVFEYAKLRSGLQSATVSQAFWITDQLLNVTTAGKFLFDHRGVQNETVLFVPGRGDLARFEYTKLHYETPLVTGTKVTMGLSYRWNYQPWNLWVEPAYNQYVGNDRGPSLRISRWFGDVQAQAYLRRSESTTFAGFRLAFPLTGRQGMAPGWSQLNGSSQFSYGLETRLATPGECNCIQAGIAEEIPLASSLRNSLLNQGRVGKDYFSSQLSRMREAALLFTVFE